MRYFYVGLVFLLNCRSDPDRKNGLGLIYKEDSFTDSLELKKIDPILIPMDSLSANYSFVMQIMDNGDHEILAFLNGASIHLYNLTARTKLKTITVDEDAQGTGRILGFKLKNMDTIAVSSRYQLHFINGEGIKFQSFNILKTATNKGLYPCGINFGTGNIIFYDRKVHLLTIPELNTRKNRKLFKGLNQLALSLDYVEDEYHWSMKFPDYAHEGGFAGIVVLWPFAAYLPEKKTFLYSFRASHDLIEHDLDELYKYHPAGSLNFPKISPAPDKVLNDSREREKHVRTIPTYRHVLYDKYRNTVIRVLAKPVTEQQFYDRKWAKYPYAIILDGKNLKKIGESDLGNEGLASMHVMISREGVLVLNSEHSDEDHMRLERFKYVKANE